MIGPLRIARYRFELEATDALHMPEYQGSTFRGGFGHALKRLVCRQPNALACTPCAHKASCPYGYVFESTAPEEGPGLHQLREIPQPFVIEAPSGERRVYRPGEPLGFDLVLIGRGIGYLPYFLLGFTELGDLGVGKPPGRYTLRAITALHPWRAQRAPVYDGADVRIDATDLSVGWADLVAQAAQLPTDQLTLRFLTPTRIKHQHAYVPQPEFHMLVRALLRRISALALFHGGAAWQGDPRALIAAAEQVETVSAQLRWVEWGRFSGRQQQQVLLGGFVGEITFRGDLAPFREYLLLGTLVHVGKAAVFGHGRYVVGVDDDRVTR